MSQCGNDLNGKSSSFLLLGMEWPLILEGYTSLALGKCDITNCYNQLSLREKEMGSGAGSGGRETFLQRQRFSAVEQHGITEA